MANGTGNNMRFLRDAGRGGKIFLEEICLAEVRGLSLCNVRFSKEGEFLIGEEIPLPLYWQQYIDHENPERNTGSHGSLTHRFENDRLIVEIESANASRSVGSHALLTVRPHGDGERFLYEIALELTIPEESRWRVTPNQSHGELEFCNMWPGGVFSPDRTRPTRYQSCILEQRGISRRLPLLHIDTPARQKMEMRGGDRFAWIVEDENPCIEILGTEGVEAGLCAYMWDAHFGLVPEELTADGTLEGPRTYTACFRLCSLTREEVRGWAEVEEFREPERGTIPIFRPTWNGFRHTFADPGEAGKDVWPWTTQVLRGDEADIRFSREDADGYEESWSIAIEHLRDSRSCWIATTLGPAFGDQEFPDGARYRLSGYVKTISLAGEILLRLRLHREGIGSLFDTGSYEIFSSTGLAERDCGWTHLQVVTPPVSPRPDRMHLICELNGKGICRLAAVHFEVISSGM